ncbi:MAG: ComEC/Rec2 family competence protein [bacterium]
MIRDMLVPALMVFTYAFIGGIVLGVFYPLGPGPVFYLWITTGILAFAGLAGLWLQIQQEDVSKIFFYGLLIVIAFCVGWGRYSIALGELYEGHLTEKGHLSEGFSDSRIVEGEVVAQPQVYEDRVRLQITPDKLWLNPEEDEAPVDIKGGDILVQVRRKHAEADYSDYGIPYEELARNSIYGDRLRIKGALMEPAGSRNPGGFSYRQFLNNQGIYAAVWFAEDLDRVSSGRGNAFVAWALNLQTEMLKVIKKTMPYPQSAFLGGATLGLRHGLEYTLMPFGEMPDHERELVNKQFRGAGTFHVLAVSGLHVGVIAVAFWAFFAGIRIPPKLYAPLIVVCLLIFTIITGARPATMRAAIMTSLMIMTFAYLEQSLKNSVLVGITLAALLILLYHPQLVFEASFTLSFTAVLCLALITGPVDRVLQKLSGLSFILFWVCAVSTMGLLILFWNTMLTWYVYLPYIIFWVGAFIYARKVDQETLIAGGIGFLDVPPYIRNFIAAQFAIQLGMMWPLSAYYFLEYPFAGIVANFFAIPLVGVVVPLGLMAGLIGLIPGVGPWLALVLNAGNYLAVNLFLWISHAVMKVFPYPAVQAFSVWNLGIFYGAIALFVWWDSVYEIFKDIWFWLVDKVFVGSSLHPRRAMIYLFATAAILIYVSTFFTSSAPDQLEVTVLDIGFGEAIAVQTPKGGNILINAGKRQWDWHNEEKRPERFDDGRNAVSNFFLNQKIKTLDLFGVQSPLPQRIGGAAYIADQFVVEKAFGPLDPERFLTRDGQMTRRRYVAALDDEYLVENERLFDKDFYGNWKRWWRPIAEKDISYVKPRRNEVVYSEDYGDKELRIIALHPPEQTSYDRYATHNKSIVFRVEFGDVSILLPGDIHGEAQQQLSGLSASYINHDVMLVPAYGFSEDSFNRSFFKAVDPEYIIMATGDSPDVTGGFAITPWMDVEKRIKSTWESYNEVLPSNKMFRTDVNGAITVKTDGRKLEVDPTLDFEVSADEGSVQETGW